MAILGFVHGEHCGVAGMRLGNRDISGRGKRLCEFEQNDSCLGINGGQGNN